MQGTSSLSFSSSGKLLVSVGLDDKYTVGVWRWKEGSLVARYTFNLLTFKVKFRSR